MSFLSLEFVARHPAVLTPYLWANLVAFVSRTGPTPFIYRFRVEPTAEGSRVILEGSITGEGLKGPTALLATGAGRLFGRGMTENLKRLKTRLES